MRRLSLALGAALLMALPVEVADGCLAHRSATVLKSAASKILPPLWIGPAFSGSWYNASRSGEGFILQVQDNGLVTAVWFTYPPVGSSTQQAWIFAQDGVINGDRVTFPTVFTTRGPRFGTAFDPAALQTTPWGTLELRFTDCNQGSVSWSGPQGWGSGTRSIERLTTIDELGCAPKRKLAASGSRTLEGLRQRSAAWFDPTHSGEGWLVEELPDGRALVYWFTYDERGEQAWTIGTAPASGTRMVVGENLQPVGTNFGSAFDPAAIRREPWGSFTLEFAGCDRGQLDYQSSKPAFGSGTLRPIRLNRLAGNSCHASAPRPATGGDWSNGAGMPGPQSETATVVLDGKIHVAGGFGGPRGFKRYDPVANSWTVLSSVPAGRDHPMAAVVGGQLLYTGGYPNGSANQSVAGWRYITAENRWQETPGLPFNAASGGAALNGYAWFADISGDLAQFDPRSGALRFIPGDGLAPRDHSNLVAFQGELWLLGGRAVFTSESKAVSIYDPVSESWRVGPPLLHGRGGFAAAASDTHIFVAGGEILAGDTGVLAQMDGIVAGESQWAPLLELPLPVHGVGGALIPGDKAFYVLSGSTQAATAVNTPVVQIYRWE